MENEEKKEIKPRSKLYPRYDLEDSIKFIEVVNKLGGTRVSNEAVAAEVGKAVNNSTFIGRISSSKQFGILIQESGKLSLSPIGKSIIFPRDESEKMTAIKVAFSTPALYKKLIDAFNGKTIPELTALGNRLVHDYDIEAGAKDSAGRNFIQSAQFAGVLQNGILVATSNDSENFPQMNNGREDNAKNGNNFAGRSTFEDFSVPKLNQNPVFNDSGNGWSLSIKSTNSFNSDVRKKLIEISELLEEINGEKKS